MIFDRNGTQIKYGDVCRDESEKQSHGMYRYCFEMYRGPQLMAVFIDRDGRRAEKPASQKGIVDRLLLIVDSDQYEQVVPSRWVTAEVNEEQVLVCDCCGSPIPVRSDSDDISLADNRYCYFCGARMEDDYNED